MRKLISSMALLVAGLSQTADSHPNYNLRWNVQVPYGKSSIEWALHEKGSFNPIRILYARTASCPVIPFTNLLVKYADQDEWQSASQFHGGYYFHGDSTIEKLKVEMSQWGIYNQTCQMLLTGYHTIPKPDDGDGDDNGDETPTPPEGYLAPSLDRE